MQQSLLTNPAWWRGLATLLWRQAVQVAAPLLAAIVLSADHIDLGPFAVSLAGALAVTLFAGLWRALRDVPDTTPLGRIVRAAAGVLAGVAVTDLADFLTVDWRATLGSAAAAAALAAIHLSVRPPAPARPAGDPATW